ncbi:MAG TPA: DUF2846 domain-containing protein [Gammaproteobacteria bacterium]|nr:DUF2846 domain-containing protein [Gammaproteobacteria bacterium]
MTLYKRLLSLLLLGALALLSGCASVPMATKADDAMAKQFKVSPDKARIYVYRNEMLGAAIPMVVALDGKVMGKTAAKTYFVFEVNPGPHEIMSQGEKDKVLTVNAEAGKNYYVWQEVKMGAFMAGSKLQLVDEATGQAGVKECKLAVAGN